MSNESKKPWYIAKSGSLESIVEFDTCISMGYKSGAALPVKPVENGSFFTANKWTIPYQIVMELAVSRTNFSTEGDGGGSERNLADIMNALERWKDSTDLVDVVTPYKTYIHGNIFDVEYRFDNDETGADMLVPMITLQEIRLINTSASTTEIKLSGAKNPDSADAIDMGQVSPKKASSDLVQIIDKVASWF